MRNKLLLAGILVVVFLLCGCIQTTPEEYCTKQGTGEKMSLSEARQIATNSACAQDGALTNNSMCNEITGTWWIDITPYKEAKGCSPACVVNVATKEAETNWRCTGLLPS